MFKTATTVDPQPKHTKSAAQVARSPKVCPLTMAPVGQNVRLCQLCGGRRMAHRLAELGLTPGVCLRVVQDGGGPLLISVRDSRIALGRGIASKLRVELTAD